MEKARTFPFFESPKYALRYISNTIRRLISNEQNKPVWGIAYNGIQQDLVDYGLWYVCAMQWANSIEKGFQGLSSIAIENVLTVKYEDFVREPQEWLIKIADFLLINCQEFQSAEIYAGIHATNVRKCMGKIPYLQLSLIQPQIEGSMELCGYRFYQ